MHKFNLLIFITVMLFSNNLRAQQIDAQSFKPNPWAFADGLPTTLSGKAPVKGSYTLGFLANYQRAPLTLWQKNTWNVESHVINHQLTGDLLLGYSLLRWFDIGLAIPLVMFQSGDGFPSEEEPGTFGIGDIRILPRFQLYKKGPLAIAFIPQLVLPTGKLVDQYMGGAGLQFIPTLAGSLQLGAFTLSTNLYYRVVEDSQIAGLKLEDEIGLHIGASYTIKPKKLDIFGEVYGRTLSTEPFSYRTQAPLEILAGAKYSITKNLALLGGIGAGITKGYATPDYRIFTGIGWINRGSLDPDKDGIFGDKDGCPNTPEDLDGYKDYDGCPDYDNDNDGIPDTKDGAPGKDAHEIDGFIKTKEDKDGYKDSDGIPDNDNDGDGIEDAKDKCPGTQEQSINGFKESKETVNGYKDDDGCPELDKDGDGIVDGKDKCPLKPEDKDGFQDTDGCPDPDNDNDGVLDSKDGAPGTDKDVATNFKSTKEDTDGFEDTDGIPDPDNDGDNIPDSKDSCPGTDVDKKTNFKKTKENINGIEDFDGCPDKGKTLVKLTASKIDILQKVYFAYNRDKIKTRSYNLLNQVASLLKTYKRITLLEIQGHTDGRGKYKRNIALSLKRAKAVKLYLIKKGIKASRLTAKGYGPDKPLKNCKTIRSGRARRKCRGNNRRVEFSIKNHKTVK
jgi:outer membrane protein OmpA-like peptidoglycan-associated protein